MRLSQLAQLHKAPSTKILLNVSFVDCLIEQLTELGMGMDWGLWIVKLVKHQSKAHCWAWQMAHCLRIRIRGHLIDTFLAIWLRTRSSVGRNYVLAVGGAGGCRKLNSSSCSMRSNLILIVVVNEAWLVHWAHLIEYVESLIL